MGKVISKESFCKVMGYIKEQQEIDEKVGQALELVCDNMIVYGTENGYLKALVKILKELFDDRSDIIEWWLYEDVEKNIYYDNKTINVETADKLYDFLIEDMAYYKMKDEEAKK